MPHLLELFSGTGSVGKAFREIGWDVTSVDLNPKAGADYTCDVCLWEPPEGVHYDHIHASPPCTEFSRALTTRPRDLAAGLRPALRALELIRRLKPSSYTLENPGTGLMPQQEAFRDLPCKQVTYCRWGYPYHKLTWFATDLREFWQAPPVCTTKDPCAQKVGSRHPESAQRGPCMAGGRRFGGHCTQAQLYSIPGGLWREIAAAASKALCAALGSS